MKDRRILCICFISSLQCASGGSLFGTLLDYGTPMLSTADAGSDAYVCYHFLETAQAEHEKPVFFFLSLSLIGLSSLCGVVMFIFFNWGKSEGENSEDDDPNRIFEEQLGLVYDETDTLLGDVEASSSTLLARLDIRARLSSTVGFAAAAPLVQLVLKALMLLGLVLALLPLGQLLPILLWLQAKQETTRQPRLPEKPPEPKKPELPKEVASLLGQDPNLRDLYSLFPKVSKEQQEILIRFSGELRRWQQDYDQWYVEEYLPYRISLDRYFQWELKNKVATQLPFAIETSVEAIPQSLLQTSAIVIESQRNPAAISWTQFLSIGISMISIASKAYTMCTSLVREIAYFKMLILAYDVSALFYSVAAFWAARRGDEDSVSVFFLTRPVDLCTAVFVWIWFAWAIIFAVWSFARSNLLVLDWVFSRCISAEFGENKFGDGSQVDGIINRFFDGVAKTWGKKLSFFSEDPQQEQDAQATPKTFDPDKATWFSIALIVLLNAVIVFLGTCCGLALIVVPLLIFLQGLRLTWMFVWIYRKERYMSEPTLMGPFTLTPGEVLSHKLNAEAQQLFGTVVYDKNDDFYEVHLSMNIEDLESDACRVLTSIEDSFETIAARISSEQGVFFQQTVFGAYGMPEIIVEFAKAEDPKKWMEECNKKARFYSQAFAWTAEGNDFWQRLAAVKHAVLAQHQSVNSPYARLPPFPGCLYLRFCAAVVSDISSSFSLVRVPRGVLCAFCGNLFDAFAQRKGIMISITRAVVEGAASKPGEYDVTVRSILSSPRGIAPYLFLCDYCIMPIGWLSQKLLVFITCLGATYSFLFPILSFSLQFYRAIQSNECGDVMALKKFGSTPSQDFVWAAARSLFDRDCYSHTGKPLNLFRTLLFLLQALVLAIVVLYGIVGARKFIVFSMFLPKYDLDSKKDAEGLMLSVRNIYEQQYRLDQEILSNDEGRSVKQRPSGYFYCGEVIPDSDGCCGSSQRGLIPVIQCEACKRFQASHELVTQAAEKQSPSDTSEDEDEAGFTF